MGRVLRALTPRVAPLALRVRGLRYDSTTVTGLGIGAGE